MENWICIINSMLWYYNSKRKVITLQKTKKIAVNSVENMSKFTIHSQGHSESVFIDKGEQ